MEILSCNAKSTVSHLLYKEESDRYFVDYSLFDEYQWLSDGSFVALSEKDGWRRAYLHNAQGSQLRALTPAEMDVTALYAVDENSQTLYYQAATTPATRDIYAVSIKPNGKNPSASGNATHTPVKLSEGEGTHSARFSKDAKRMIDCFQSFDTPNTYTLYTIKGANKTQVRLILDHSATVWHGLRIVGLMAMATNTDDETEIRRCFKEAAKCLNDAINDQMVNDQIVNNSAVLSMGMSDDYRIAIECGSNMVRIGSSIFGERTYK
jgi:hypothetical protein